MTSWTGTRVRRRRARFFDGSRAWLDDGCQSTSVWRTGIPAAARRWQNNNHRYSVKRLTCATGVGLGHGRAFVTQLLYTEFGRTRVFSITSQKLGIAVYWSRRVSACNAVRFMIENRYSDPKRDVRNTRRSRSAVFIPFLKRKLHHKRHKPVYETNRTTTQTERVNRPLVD